MDFVATIKSKYTYLTNTEAATLSNRARAILVEQLFPTDLSISYETYVVPSRFNMWILDCVDELIERAGASSMTAYRENGISMTWGKGGVSDGLLQRLPRIAGTVKR